MSPGLKEIPRTPQEGRPGGAPRPDRASIARFLVPALGTLLVLPILYGAWRGFPVYDDAYLFQFLRELGPGSIAADHPDRPLFGILMQGMASVFGLSRAPYVAVALAFWLLLAWQTGRLWKRVFRERPELAPAAGLLVLSPIVVDTQFTTLTTVLPIQLPVSLALAGVLLGLRRPEREIRWLPVGVALVFAAALVSEYALATVLAGAALLAVRRRFRPAIALVSGVAVGEIARRTFADVGARQDTIPGGLLVVASHEPLKIAGQWVTGIWQSLGGTWLSAAGSLRAEASSRSTLLAVLLALAAGVLAARWSRRAVGGGEPRMLSQSVAAPAAAVAAGLLPVVLAVRPASLAEYSSRFRTPILPFATVAFVAICYRVFYARWRPLAFAALFFVAEFRSVDRSFAIARQQALLARVGDVLRQTVATSPGIAVGVIPSQGADGADLTQKVTRSWSVEDARRAWTMNPQEAEDLFGPRADCGDTRRIDTPRRIHFVGRHGAVSRLVWFPIEGDRFGTPESYCVDPSRAIGQAPAGGG